MITRRVVRWFDDRLRFASVGRTTLAKVFPDHWSFMLGEIALYAFTLLVLTGVFLTLFFDPSSAERVYTGSYAPLAGKEMSAAYASTVELSWDVRMGLVMRQAHHWAALIFVAAILVHLSRIFLTGAFRKPRELNWVVGLTMLLLAMGNGFLGYSMPDDLLSGTGLRIAYSVLLSVPVVGPWAAFLAFGGEFPGESIIPRLYIAHVLLVPALLAGLISAHLAVIVRQKHTHFGGPGRSDVNVVGSKMWPTYAFRSLGLLCLVASVVFLLGGLAQINPVWLWGEFDPAAVSSPAQPDWYVGWVDGALRLVPPLQLQVFGYVVPPLFWPGLVLPGLTFLVGYAWPFLEPLVTGDRARHHVAQHPSERPGRVAVWGWAAAFYGLLLAAGAIDIAARVLHMPILTILWAVRVAVLVVPFVVAAVFFVLARALRDSDASGLSELRWRDVAAAARPGRRRRQEEREEREEPREPAPPLPGLDGHARVQAEDAPPLPAGRSEARTP